MSEVEHANVPVRPPALILATLLLACLLELVWPLGPGLANGSYKPILIGLGIALLGATLMARARTQFAAVGNELSPRQPDTALVTSGVFAWSRNPIYIGHVMAYFGLVLALTSVWGLILLPFLLALYQRAIIPAEEHYLRRRFGAAYEAYAAKVPRWL